MRSAPKNRGYSLIELMVGCILLSVVTIGAMGIMNRLQRKEKESSLLAEYALVGQQLDTQINYDLKNATHIDGPATNSGTQFDTTATYGIMRISNSPTAANPRSPFAQVAGAISDKIQIFVTDPSLSVQSSAYDVLSLGGTSGVQTMVVDGDFTATAELAEDLFIAVVDYGGTIGNKKELFRVVANSVQPGTTAGTTQFQTTCYDTGSSNTACAKIQTAANAHTNPPQIYRVQRVVYQVGNGTSTTRGLYRIVNGSTVKVADDVASLQILYQLSTSDVAKQADCASNLKNNTRYFDNPSVVPSTTLCSWNEIVAVHLELVLESPTDLGAPQNFNPHNPTVVDGKVRYTVHLSKVPTKYTS